MSTCENYLVRKITRKLFGKPKRAEFPLQLTHSDICAPIIVRARFYAIYINTFIDYFKYFGYVHLISHKSKALECFKRYMNEFENQLVKSTTVLRTIQECEYLSKQFDELYTTKGVIGQLTTPYTSQQNGVAEKRNRTLLNITKSKMT